MCFIKNEISLVILVRSGPLRVGLNFQCRMRLEHEGSVLPHFHIVPANLLDCSDCNWMKMQVHFWENAQVTHHCHLASSSSSQSSASWVDCRIFLQVVAVLGLSCGGSGGSTGLSGDTLRGAGGMG